MEVIINGSSFTVSGNTFSGNSSSGIALQSYGGGGGGAKTGSFVLTGNTFSGNGNFGIDCKNPLGTGGAFFVASVKATNNTFTGNKKGETNGECGIRNIVVVEKTEEDEQSEPEESLEEELQEEEDMTALSQDIATKRERLDALQQEVALLEAEASAYVQKRGEQSGRARLLGGTPEQKLLEGRILEKQDHLKRKTESCAPVDTYEVSVETAGEHFLCTKEDRLALMVTLEKIASQVRTPTYQEKAVQKWQRFIERLSIFYRDLSDSSDVLP